MQKMGSSDTLGNQSAILNASEKWQKKCPREDSSLRLHGFAFPQRDDLTTNRQGPKVNRDSGLLTS